MCLLYKCVPVHMCVCRHMCACVHLCAQAFGGHKLTSCVFFNFSVFFIRNVFLYLPESWPIYLLLPSLFILRSCTPGLCFQMQKPHLRGVHDLSQISHLLISRAMTQIQTFCLQVTYSNSDSGEVIWNSVPFSIPSLTLTSSASGCPCWPFLRQTTGTIPYRTDSVTTPRACHSILSLCHLVTNID